MRAALNEHGLFCLAFAEVLSYEESDQIFQFLQQLMKESKSNGVNGSRTKILKYSIVTLHVKWSLTNTYSNNKGFNR